MVFLLVEENFIYVSVVTYIYIYVQVTIVTDKKEIVQQKLGKYPYFNGKACMNDYHTSYMLTSIRR